jgi:hypothetical protein
LNAHDLDWLVRTRGQALGAQLDPVLHVLWRDPERRSAVRRLIELAGEASGVRLAATRLRWGADDEFEDVWLAGLSSDETVCHAERTGFERVIARVTQRTPLAKVVAIYRELRDWRSRAKFLDLLAQRPGDWHDELRAAIGAHTWDGENVAARVWLESTRSRPTVADTDGETLL